MTNLQEVLAVLEAARDRVAQNWGQRTRWSNVQLCASTAILTEVADEGYSLGVAKAAHAAFLRGAGLRVPKSEFARRTAVYRFNDAQTSAYPVVSAFVKAIAALRAELEPKGSDMTDSQKVLAVLEAARLDVVRHWTERGGYCASVVIVIANQSLPGEDVTVAAHAALLRSVCIPVPTSKHAICHAVYDWDDAQTSVYPVVAAFDRAIAELAELDVPSACNGHVRDNTRLRALARTVQPATS